MADHRRLPHTMAFGGGVGGKKSMFTIVIAMIGCAILAVIAIQVSFIFPFLMHDHDHNVPSNPGHLPGPEASSAAEIQAMAAEMAEKIAEKKARKMAESMAKDMATDMAKTMANTMAKAMANEMVTKQRKEEERELAATPPAKSQGDAQTKTIYIHSVDVPPPDPPVIPEKREDRFPSVDERVRIYMSDWYVPPCPDHLERFTHFRHIVRESTDISKQEREKVKDLGPPTKSKNKDGTVYERLGSVVTYRNEWNSQRQHYTDVWLERIFMAFPEDILRCKESGAFPQYCGDIVNSILGAIKRLGEDDDPSNNWNLEIPIIMHIGDLRYPMNTNGMYPNLPIIKKFRYSMPPDEVMRKTSMKCHSGPRPIRRIRELEPIIWKLNVERHYGTLRYVHKSDIPWSKKIPKAVFRGKYTGPTVPHFEDDACVCYGMPRCHLVYTHNNSTLVDAKLTSKIEEYINGVQVLGNEMSVRDILQFKAVIMVEGNDVATGLKWALLSNSVVLMTKPAKMTYAMEDNLIPWVHYIPLRDDFSDVEEKTQWVIDNDFYAQQIAKRATLWIQDLVLHEDSDKDHAKIEEQILVRYQKHFLKNETLGKLPKTR